MFMSRKLSEKLDRALKLRKSAELIDTFSSIILFNLTLCRFGVFVKASQKQAVNAHLPPRFQLPRVAQGRVLSFQSIVHQMLPLKAPVICRTAHTRPPAWSGFQQRPLNPPPYDDPKPRSVLARPPRHVPLAGVWTGPRERPVGSDMPVRTLRGDGPSGLLCYYPRSSGPSEQGRSAVCSRRRSRPDNPPASKRRWPRGPHYIGRVRGEDGAISQVCARRVLARTAAAQPWGRPIVSFVNRSCAFELSTKRL